MQRRVGARVSMLRELECEEPYGRLAESAYAADLAS